MKKIPVIISALILLTFPVLAVQLGQGLGDKFNSVSVGTIEVISNISTGTYTPEVTADLNVGALAVGLARWVRVGNYVSVSGYIGVDPVVANNDTTFYFTLPIASVFTDYRDAGGPISGQNAAQSGSGYAFGDVRSGRVYVNMTFTGTTNCPSGYNFSYFIR